VSRVVVLDAEALSVLARERGPRFREVRAALEAARLLARDVVTPAVILAEVYRGPRHNQVVDSCLSRETGISVRSTDREFARLVGGILASAGADSSDMADAHAVAAAVETGGGVILTADEADLLSLADAYPTIQVVAI
jgi:predicted nucleic acid-binding protein